MREISAASRQPDRDQGRRKQKAQHGVEDSPLRLGLEQSREHHAGGAPEHEGDHGWDAALAQRHAHKADKSTPLRAPAPLKTLQEQNAELLKRLPATRK